MGREREVKNPIVKTYLTITRKKTGRIVHARVYAPSYNRDRKGSGATIDEAIDDAMRDVPLAQPILRKKP